ncbi:MAG TPA: LPXTG cell wall anchor domain-containing protein, partial [Candidatus Saccharimonas sp.]|nr:LPXTG cell wall anchor domain-containing protein [Candidatus Saccharimonas sp.]
KDVMNQTAQGAFADADTTGSAVVARPGATLVYRIVVADLATGDQDQMINTKVTDTLPAGLQLVSQDSFNLGTVAQGKSKTVTITAKVTANTNTTITNQACFTGDSADYKLPQKGCEVAVVKVVVPDPTPTPTPSVTPTPTPAILSATTKLPDTGATGTISTIAGLLAMAVAAVVYLKTRQSAR